MNNKIRQSLAGTAVFFREHRFLFLVFSSIIVSIMLVMISLGLYVSSGTEQLDLSRPGYASIREQLQSDSNGEFQSYDAAGELDQKALDEFDTKYSDKLKEATSVDAFGNDVLSPKSLQIDETTAKKSQEQ